MRQRTIKSIVEIEGKGLHTGKLCKVKLIPNEANSGIVFKVNKDGKETLIPACAKFIGDTSRNTTIENDGVKVSTIEHLMATLRAFGIDNIIVETNCEEVPILDGSAKYWVELIKKAEIVEQEVEKKE